MDPWINTRIIRDLILLKDCKLSSGMLNLGEMACTGMHRGYCLHSFVASRESGPRHPCGPSDGGGHRRTFDQRFPSAEGQ